MVIDSLGKGYSDEITKTLRFLDDSELVCAFFYNFVVLLYRI